MPIYGARSWRRQVGRIDVGDGATHRETLPEQVAERLEDTLVDGLVGLVVRKQ